MCIFLLHEDLILVCHAMSFFAFLSFSAAATSLCIRLAELHTGEPVDWLIVRYAAGSVLRTGGKCCTFASIII